MYIDSPVDYDVRIQQAHYAMFDLHLSMSTQVSLFGATTRPLGDVTSMNPVSLSFLSSDEDSLWNISSEWK